MKRFLLTTLLILSAAVAGAAEKINLKTIPAEKFLEIARRAPAQETWARMDGIIQHRRSGAATITSTLRLRVRFTPARIIGQVILDDEEYYNLGQTFSNPPQSTRTLGGRALEPDKAKLGLYGVSPDDLLLGFLYQDLVEEEKSMFVSIYHTRVLLMRSKDSGEFARVCISTDYAFPIRVEWFKKNPVAYPLEKAYRTMEVTSIKEKGEFVMVAKLGLNGPGWRTRIEFQDFEAGDAGESMPKNLFMRF